MAQAQAQQQQQLQRHDAVLSPHSSHTFVDIENAGGAPADPLNFPRTRVQAAITEHLDVLVDPTTGETMHCHGVIRSANRGETVAYWPQKQLERAIYGSVWACSVLRLRSQQDQTQQQQQQQQQQQPQQSRLKGLLGRGGSGGSSSSSGAVQWEMTPDFVAIKMLYWAKIKDAQGKAEDPLKEISAMQLLQQQGQESNDEDLDYVITSTAVLQDKQYLYSIMPYCANGDLFGIVVRYATASGGQCGMPEPVARHVFRQLLRGMHFLQKQGICHRDLSLENVLLDANMRCKIIDFGMCLRIPYSDASQPEAVTDVTQGSMRRLMKPQRTCGKWKYMSPEVRRSKEPMDGFAVDLWSVGVILYTMLTGFCPYEHAGPIDRRYNQIVKGYLMQQLQDWGIELSAEAGDLLQNMLRQDPRDRLTLAQIWEHPWVTLDEVEEPEV